MAKRFFDTELMKKDWFQRLPSVYKCFWYFLLSECDCVGVWSINWRMCEFVLGEKIDTEKAIFYLSEQLEFISGTKIFIKDFCKFQYGELNENCKPHRKYITVLQEHGLYERVSKGYPKGIHTLQEKEKEKEKDCINNTSIIYSLPKNPLADAMVPLSPELEEMYKKWLNWKAERKDPVFPSQQVELRKLIRRLGVSAVPAINTAIANGWKSICPDKEQKQKIQQKTERNIYGEPI